jgi:hypothetical protein
MPKHGSLERETNVKFMQKLRGFLEEWKNKKKYS